MALNVFSSSVALAGWRSVGVVVLAVMFFALTASAALPKAPFKLPTLAKKLADHPGQSAISVLDRGEQSLLARAWLCDNSVKSIDVQYFIWSTDNIGILAAETLLRAADRGVRVRVIVDDLLVDGPPASMAALDAHPNISIKIYNPLHSVGVSFPKRLWHLVTDFRGSNQRMHDKTLIVDGVAAITGGRNVADEYFDYDHEYNFRDRDAFVAGPVVAQMARSFELFWADELSVPVETILSELSEKLSAQEVAKQYAGLHSYAKDPENLEPQVLSAIRGFSDELSTLLDNAAWGEVTFLHDMPGKNDATQGLGGGGETTRRLVEAVEGARKRVTIQTPYLIFPEGGLELFAELIGRGVEVRISTNSLASTDNLQAFSGYANQRDEIIAAGIEVREYRPYPQVMRNLIERMERLEHPIFAMHAKTLVVDGQTLFVGTFNLDPRSANLNTEVGVMIRNGALAGEVEAAIFSDMEAANSWNPATEDPDGEASFWKRCKLLFWRLIPMDPIL